MKAYRIVTDVKPDSRLQTSALPEGHKPPPLLPDPVSASSALQLPRPAVPTSRHHRASQAPPSTSPDSPADFRSSCHIDLTHGTHTQDPASLGLNSRAKRQRPPSSPLGIMQADPSSMRSLHATRSIGNSHAQVHQALVLVIGDGMHQSTEYVSPSCQIGLPRRFPWEPHSLVPQRFCVTQAGSHHCHGSCRYL